MSDLISRKALIQDIMNRPYIDKALAEIFETIIDEQQTCFDSEDVECAFKQVERYEKQYIDDLENPLEPLKISSALNSQIMVLEYRKEHAPKEVNILDYTIIAALKDCLERRIDPE